MRAFVVLWATVLSMTGCGSDPMPPTKVKPGKDATKPESAEATKVPAGVVYGFDASCDKCKRVRGDGCVTRMRDRKPLGCGWVAPDGKRAAVAWVVRSPEVRRTLWWYGSDGQTKKFWTPCEDPDCEATVGWAADGRSAVVSFGAEGAEAAEIEYDVDTGRVVEK